MKKDESHNNTSTNSSEETSRSFLSLFFSAQVAALIGTAFDFLTVIFLTEIMGVWYVMSNAIGATCGAIVNFLLGRYWVFNSTQKKMYQQAGKYFLVATGSMILNTFGVWLLTEFTELHYIWSKAIVAVLIAVTFNFFLQKNFVFK